MVKDPLNILLVDDQPGKLLSYEAILQELGENLIKANSGREALEQLLKTEIPVVLMDVSMPELDGFELAEIIRQHPRCRKTAIIFVSAVHLSDIDRLKAYETGAVDYVSVPIVPELLRAKVSVFTELYRKRRDAERLNQELEGRVAARTAELEQAVMQQTALTGLLREADRRKDEFLALLAHELRNPLAPLTSAVDIMKRKDIADPDIVWCRNIMERQVRQLTRLVDDLLDVSRITLGKIKLQNEAVDLAEVVQAVVEARAPMINEHRHTLDVAIPEEPVMVHGDPTRLTQVIANLLNNAIHYQRDGGSVGVRVERDGAQARVVVTDSGIGISPELLPDVFNLFVQGEQLPERGSGGLGVGLSLVKTVVELHGGSVTAESAGTDCGSQFTVHLPLLSARPLPREASAAATAGNAAPQGTILIVDDNADAAESLATLLRMTGHPVVLAHNGTSALATVASEHPATMLVDIGMPGMDGYELCRRVRAMGHADAVIIAITGYGQERDRQLATAAGFDAHAIKPIDFDALLQIIERCRATNRPSHQRGGATAPGTRLADPGAGHDGEVHADR